MGINEKERDRKKRTFNFAQKSVGLVKSLPKDIVNQHLGHQYLKASTSVGSNYREADGAESTKDFLHKIGVVLKEAKESLYWLGLLKPVNILLKNEIDWLIIEARELSLIFSKIIINVKAKL